MNEQVKQVFLYEDDSTYELFATNTMISNENMELTGEWCTYIEDFLTVQQLANYLIDYYDWERDKAYDFAQKAFKGE